MANFVKFNSSLEFNEVIFSLFEIPSKALSMVSNMSKYVDFLILRFNVHLMYCV
jgi:hypothetical protein